MGETLLLALLIYAVLVLLVIWAAARSQMGRPVILPPADPIEVARRIRAANPQLMEVLDAPARRQDAVGPAGPGRRVGRVLSVVAVDVGHGGLSECRTDWVMRHLVDIVTAAVRRGDLTVTTAAQQLRAHMVPQHVALRVLGGMQCK